MTALRELEHLLDGLERAGTSVMAQARGGRPQEAWTLYPDEYGIFDRKRHSQFYYHAHACAEHEAGHFHTVRLFRDHTQCTWWRSRWRRRDGRGPCSP